MQMERKRVMDRFSSKPSFIFLLLLLLLLQISTSSSSGVNYQPCTNRSGIMVCANLNYIPVLPPNTTSLFLINFHVGVLSRHTLSNLTRLPLKELQLRSPIWKSVTTDVFTDMVHLQTLTISRLKAFSKLPTLFLSLNFTNITTLGVHLAILRRLDPNLFEGLRNTNLRRLYLRNCQLKNFDGTYLMGLKTLRLLDLSANDKLHVESWGHLPSLRILNLTGTYMEHLLSFQNESLRTGNVYPELRTLYLSLSEGYLINEVTFRGLPKLTRLTIQAMDTLQIMTDTIGHQLPKLKNVSLIGIPNVLLSVDNKAIISFSLQSLKLRNVTLTSSNDPFYCPNLTTFLLSRFKSVKDTKLIRVLSTLQQLKSLEISNSRITAVPAPICNITTLTNLDLHGNFIYSWKTKDCKVMKHLEKFSLARNDIKKINKFSFSEMMWENPKLKWDLSYNSYRCNCDILWFRDWLLKTKTRVLNYPKGYRCKLLSGLYVKIPSFDLTWEYCRERSRTSPLILAAIFLAALALILITCSIVAYIKRWSVRFWCFLLCTRRCKYTPLVDNIDYIYDAFICYNSGDLEWVMNKLLPVIEETEGFQLCLHDRDFKAGYDIYDNIAESVQTSRRVVLLLSPDFARCSWCQYEASLAEQRLLEDNRDMLVPILLHDIPPEDQTRRLTTLLSRITCLEWTDDERGQDVFWRRLTEILRTPPVHAEI